MTTKHDERWVAHMAVSLPDYDQEHICTKCGKLVRIRVPQPLSVVLVLQHWHDKLDGRCKACLEKWKAVRT